MSRGCRVASRLANFYPARFTAFAFFAVGYSPPNAVANWTQTNQMIKGLLKRDITGYQTWFSEDDTAKVLEDKVRTPCNYVPFSYLYWHNLIHRYYARSSTRSSVSSSPPTRKYGQNTSGPQELQKLGSRAVNKHHFRHTSRRRTRNTSRRHSSTGGSRRRRIGTR